MARAKDLAALAGLAGLAYAMRNKDKGESATDTGDETERLKARKPASEESAGEKAVSDTKSSVLTALQKPKNIREEGIAEANEVRNATSTPKSSSKPAAKAAPAKQTSSSSDRRSMESGISRGTRGADSSKAYPSGVMGGARQADTKSSAVDTAKDVAKTVAKTAIQGPAGALTTAAKPVADKAIAATGYKVPTSEEAAANRKAAYDKVKSVGSSVVDYVKNFETPAERRSREAKEAKDTPPKARTDSPLGRKMESEILNNMITNPPMKKGGMVKPKKMASGGMTSMASSASKRADGIATRGKTKCKMY